VLRGTVSQILHSDRGVVVSMTALAENGTSDELYPRLVQSIRLIQKEPVRSILNRRALLSPDRRRHEPLAAQPSNY
jgi:hypothetical protein